MSFFSLHKKTDYLNPYYEIIKVFQLCFQFVVIFVFKLSIQVIILFLPYFLPCTVAIINHTGHWRKHLGFRSSQIIYCLAHLHQKTAYITFFVWLGVFNFICYYYLFIKLRKLHLDFGQLPFYHYASSFQEGSHSSWLPHNSSFTLPKVAF